MSVPLLVESYIKLPQPQLGDDPDLLQAGMQDALREFRDDVRAKYSEGTLHRLLASGDLQCRRAAALALGLVGSMRSNLPLAAALKDPDTLVRKFSADSMREIWLRGEEADHAWMLQEALRLPDHAQTLAALDELIREAPAFAEAYNQRAVLLFRRGDYSKAVTDCESALRLNPAHFGAAAGLGRCYLRLNRPRAALRALQKSLDIFPGFEEVRDTLRELRAALGDGDNE